MSSAANRLPAAPSQGVRWLAVFCALTVWMLGLLAASPVLHAALHADADQSEHDCAITLFSHGTDAPLTATGLVRLPATRLIALQNAPETPLVESPRDWQRPGRGPPRR